MALLISRSGCHSIIPTIDVINLWDDVALCRKYSTRSLLPKMPRIHNSQKLRAKFNFTLQYSWYASDMHAVQTCLCNDLRGG